MVFQISRKSSTVIMATLLLAAGSNVSHAIGTNSTGGKWEYSLAPLFLWAQGIEGVSEIGPTTAPLSIKFADAFENLETTFTIHYEMKRDALTLFAEYQLVELGPTAEGPMNSKLNINFKNRIGELGAAYWVYGTERTNWEILGGARYTKQNLKASVKGGPKLVSAEEDWWVAFFGGRFSTQFTANWSFVGRVDFGLGSGETNQIWNLNGMFDYRFNKWGSVFAGYKWMDYDYENSDKGLDHYAYDATQQGPLVGLNVRW